MVDRIQDLVFDPTPAPEILTERPDQLGENAFLQLLIAQLQNQNPLEPLDNFEFISQMAQFGTLEQITALNAALSGFAEFAALGQLASMIGKEVTIISPGTGDEITGIVSAVTLETGAPHVIVDDVAYSLEDVVRIGLPQGGGSESP
jgi:flagellar basal-body rod modification protein FlgD